MASARQAVPVGRGSGRTSALPLINGNKARAASLGPVISYQTDDLKTQVEFKYLKEFSARSRPQGDLFLLTLSRMF